uniref:Uncharacterized protein n=1 Tax=viral metagenome TaxID=1070528 RepID=A0A2V0RMZ9_9ZZZZ
MSTRNVLDILADTMDDHEEDRLEHDARDHVLENAQLAATDFEEGRSALDGLDNIRGCVNNPTDNALTSDGEKLFKFIGHSYTLTDESIERPAELLMEVELTKDRLIQANINMTEIIEQTNEVHTRRLDLDTEYQQHVMSDVPASRAMLRSVMSEIEDANERINGLSDDYDRSKRYARQAQIDLDSAHYELDQLRKVKITKVFNARALLFTDPRWRGYSVYDLKLRPGDKQTMKDAFVKPVLSALDALDGTEKGTNNAIQGVVSIPKGIFTEEIVQDIHRFKQSEAAKKIGNIYKLIKSLKEGKHTRILYDDVILADSPEYAEENALISEIYFLNLTAMAGYDPKSWAQAFGVPISGIGEQILSEWGNGRMGPLKPEQIMRLFENKSYAKTSSINYQELELKLSKEDRMKMKEGEVQSLARLIASIQGNEGEDEQDLQIIEQLGRTD